VGTPLAARLVEHPPEHPLVLDVEQTDALVTAHEQVPAGVGHRRHMGPETTRNTPEWALGATRHGKHGGVVLARQNNGQAVA
jgi:hypothetical protein